MSCGNKKDIKEIIMTLPAMFNVQRALSKAQALLIIGPICVSPVKAIVSLAQTIAGIAGTILCGAGLFLTRSEMFGKPLANSVGHIGLGMVSLLYSGVNMCTLGLFGLSVESFAYKQIDQISLA